MILAGRGQRTELACGEGFQGAEACVEFGGRQAPHAVELAQKIRGGTVALARVAFHTAGNEVAVQSFVEHGSQYPERDQSLLLAL